MKHLLLVIILIPIFSFSQRVLPLNLPKYDLVKLHFGMALGINQMSATVYPADDFFELDSIFSAECNPQMGFNINIVSNFNLNKYFSIRFLPGLSFGQRNMEYILYNGQKYEQKVMEIPSTYLDFPILFQLKSARLNNFRAYLIGGFSYKQDLAAQKKIADEDKPKIRFKRSTYTYQIGVGADFFLEYFKFAIETKADFGINNILVPDNSEFSSSIKAIKPRVFSVTLLFEGSDSEGLNFMKWFKK